MRAPVILRAARRAGRLVRALPLAAVAAAVLALLTAVPGQIVQASSPPTSRYEVISAGATTVSTGKPPAPWRILFVGASITAGVGAPTPAEGFATVLSHDIARRIHRPVAMTVVSHSGAVAGMARSWHVPGGQRMVILHLATNDFLHSTPLATYRANEERVLRRLRAGSPHAAMFCLGTWARPGDLNRRRIAASAYDTQVAADCRTVHGTYVELSPLFEDAALHGESTRATLAGPDLAFHPNAAGHTQIADAIMRQVNPDTMLPQESHVPSGGRPRTPSRNPSPAPDASPPADVAAPDRSAA